MSESQSNPNSELKQHYLAKRLSFRQPADVPDVDSNVLYDVPLLSAGEWHDSITPYPTVYTPENLKQFTVESDSGFRDHGFTHAMDEEIGYAKNLRYDEKTQSIMADLVFHGATQASRDTLGIIRNREERGLPNYVSIEMMTRDVPTTDGGMEAQDIVITGWIATTAPACKRCAIPKQHTANMTDKSTGAVKQLTEDGADALPNKKPEEEDTKTKQEQESCEDETGKKKSETESEDSDKESKEEEEETHKLTARINALETRLHALESQMETATGTAKQLTDRVHALEQKPTGQIGFTTKAPSTQPVVEYQTNQMW